MSYRDFTMESVCKQFDLTSDLSTDLFSHIEPYPLRPGFAETFAAHGPLAMLIGSEKARSELLIAPILAEVWHIRKHQIGVYSGLEFNVEEEIGLNGVCDFLLSNEPQQLKITAPIVAVVEAKKENILGGLGQCIAAMIAVGRFNRQAGRILDLVYGCVSSGNLWRFLILRDKQLLIDLREYALRDVERIVGIVLHIVSGSTDAK